MPSFPATYDVARYDESAYGVVPLFETAEMLEERLLRSIKELVDTTGMSDDVVAQLVLFLALSESLSMSDVRTFYLEKGLTEALDSDDTLLREFSFVRVLSETASLMDSHFKGRFLELVESFLTADALNKDVFKELFEELEGVDTVESLKAIILLLEETMSGVDNIFFSRMKELYEATSILDDLCVNRVANAVFGVRDDFRNILLEEEVSISKQDFIEVLYDMMNEKVNLVKTVSVGGDFVDEVTQVVLCVDCRIMPVSQKERNLIPLGNVTTGNMIGYFLPEYTKDSVDYKVEENDEIDDEKKGVRYRVRTIIQEQHLNTELVYIKAFLQRI